MLNLNSAAMGVLSAAMAAELHGGEIEIQSSTSVLAVLKIPSAKVDGQRVKIDGISPVDAVASGTASLAYIRNQRGVELMVGDVGALGSDAFLKMTDTKILRGGSVEIKSVEIGLEIGR